MLFKPVLPLKIEIDGNAVRADSPESCARLERIASHYRQLDELLSSVESRLPEWPTEEQPAQPASPELDRPAVRPR